MTRKEQIERAAYSESDITGEWGAGFIDGAEWADQNPDINDMARLYGPAAVVLQRDIENLEARLAVAVEALGSASKLLNNIKYDLEASVYTLTDDEFATVFYVRDRCDEALAKIKK